MPLQQILRSVLVCIYLCVFVIFIFINYTHAEISTTDQSGSEKDLISIGDVPEERYFTEIFKNKFNLDLQKEGSDEMKKKDQFTKFKDLLVTFLKIILAISAAIVTIRIMITGIKTLSAGYSGNVGNLVNALSEFKKSIFAVFVLAISIPAVEYIHGKLVPRDLYSGQIATTTTTTSAKKASPSTGTPNGNSQPTSTTPLSNNNDSSSAPTSPPSEKSLSIRAQWMIEETSGKNEEEKEAIRKDFVDAVSKAIENCKTLSTNNNCTILTKYADGDAKIPIEEQKQYKDVLTNAYNIYIFNKSQNIKPNETITTTTSTRGSPKVPNVQTKSITNPAATELQNIALSDISLNPSNSLSGKTAGSIINNALISGVERSEIQRLEDLYNTAVKELNSGKVETIAQERRALFEKIANMKPTYEQPKTATSVDIPGIPSILLQKNNPLPLKIPGSIQIPDRLGAVQDTARSSQSSSVFTQEKAPTINGQTSINIDKKVNIIMPLNNNPSSLPILSTLSTKNISSSTPETINGENTLISQVDINKWQTEQIATARAEIEQDKIVEKQKVQTAVARAEIALEKANEEYKKNSTNENKALVQNAKEALAEARVQAQEFGILEAIDRKNEGFGSIIEIPDYGDYFPNDKTVRDAFFEKERAQMKAFEEASNALEEKRKIAIKNGNTKMANDIVKEQRKLFNDYNTKLETIVNDAKNKDDIIAFSLAREEKEKKETLQTNSNTWFDSIKGFFSPKKDEPAPSAPIVLTKQNITNTPTSQEYANNKSVATTNVSAGVIKRETPNSATPININRENLSNIQSLPQVNSLALPTPKDIPNLKVHSAPPEKRSTPQNNEKKVLTQNNPQDFSQSILSPPNSFFGNIVNVTQNLGCSTGIQILCTTNNINTKTAPTTQKTQTEPISITETDLKNITTPNNQKISFTQQNVNYEKQYTPTRAFDTIKNIGKEIDKKNITKEDRAYVLDILKKTKDLDTIQAKEFPKEVGILLGNILDTNIPVELLSNNFLTAVADRAREYYNPKGVPSVGAMVEDLLPRLSFKQIYDLEQKRISNPNWVKNSEALAYSVGETYRKAKKDVLDENITSDATFWPGQNERLSLNSDDEKTYLTLYANGQKDKAYEYRDNIFKELNSYILENGGTDTLTKEQKQIFSAYIREGISAAAQETNSIKQAKENTKQVNENNTRAVKDFYLEKANGERIYFDGNGKYNNRLNYFSQQIEFKKNEKTGKIISNITIDNLTPKDREQYTDDIDSIKRNRNNYDQVVNVQLRTVEYRLKPEYRKYENISTETIQAENNIRAQESIKKLNTILLKHIENGVLNKNGEKLYSLYKNGEASIDDLNEYSDAIKK
ncbi:MAG: hypothetical protein QM526_00235 [Alphaproteobacteria bacterium]|nr:hypothetical protein [Alphaproteobacteria bacterium]